MENQGENIYSLLITGISSKLCVQFYYSFRITVNTVNVIN